MTETHHDGLFGDAPLGTDATSRDEKHRPYAELQRVLDHLEMAGRPFSRTTVGTSNQGRDIDMISVGRGDTDILFVGQQHGNESSGSTSLVALLHYLASGKSKAHLDDVTVHVVPRANPDGAEIEFRGTSIRTRRILILTRESSRRLTRVVAGIRTGITSPTGPRVASTNTIRSSSRRIRFQKREQ
ncbi:M14 family zinc carboxypeptidase [Saliphagus sp. GCM10025308]